MLRYAKTLGKISLSCALFALAAPVASSEKIRTTYDLSSPVLFTSKSTIEVQESLPILKIKTQGSQVLKFEMQAPVENDESANPFFPADVRFTLKDLFVHLSVNGEELAFDQRGDKVAVPLFHLSELIDRPMNLRIDDQGMLMDGKDSFDGLFRELPALKRLSLQKMLKEHLQHLFILQGRDIAVGDVIQTKAPALPNASSEPTLSFEIVSIDEDEVKGVLKGKIGPSASAFSKGTDKEVRMILTGDIIGNISWNRRNALLCTLTSEHRYRAKMGMDGAEWEMLMTMSNFMTASPEYVP